MELRVAGRYDVDAASLEAGLKCEDESLTLQSQAQDADINVIVRRFGVTGELPNGLRVPVYGNFEGVSDYREALDLVREADQAFMSLPADVRRRFGNDAGSFVDFASNPDNLEELRKMGLAPKAEVVNVQGKSEVVEGKQPDAASGKAAVA